MGQLKLKGSVTFNIGSNTYLFLADRCFLLKKEETKETMSKVELVITITLLIEVMVFITVICTIYRLIYWLLIEKEIYLNLMEVVCGVRSELLQKISFLFGMPFLVFSEKLENPFTYLEFDVRQWVIMIIILCFFEDNKTS